MYNKYITNADIIGKDFAHVPEYKLVPTVIPVCTVEDTPDGQLHKMGFKEVYPENPYDGIDSDQLTLQSQIDAGISIKEARPIMPDTIEAVSDALTTVQSELNRKFQSFDPAE